MTCLISKSSAQLARLQNAKAVQAENRLCKMWEAQNPSDICTASTAAAALAHTRARKIIAGSLPDKA